MSFYLKYRPQKIDQLDLEAVRAVLLKLLQAKQPPHAWLLTGPKGTGKTSSARIIAKSLNCLEKKDSAEPCCHCENCLAITKGTAIDVLEIDAASNRGIDDIRELREKIKLTPTHLRYKVYIIDEVHMLTKEAFNALLKTLEEPPAHAIFILATTEADKLPDTIVSRCVSVPFTMASGPELLRSLKRVVAGEKLKCSDNKLTEIATAAGGSFRDAVKLLEFPDNLKPLVIDDWLVLLYQKELKGALDWLVNAWHAGHEPKPLLLAAIERLRQVLLLRLGIGQTADLDKLKNVDIIKTLLSRLIAAAGELSSSPIEALPLELAVVDWCGPAPSVPPMPNKDLPDKNLAAKWPEVLTAIKPLNHGLEALLKATDPVGFTDGYLMIKVFYQFHKDRLEEERYRAMVEQVISKLWVMPVKVKYFLSTKLLPTQDEAIIQTAEEVFGIEVSK